MNATESYRAGKLQDAIDAQVKEVKANPADHSRRLFLYELLAFAGEFDRARRQIDAVQYDSPELEMAAQSYRKLIDAELFRARVFSEGVMPQFLGTPPTWVGKRLEALQALRGGKTEEAAALLAESDQAALPLKGTLNKKPFDHLRDADDLFGPTLEVMAHGDYYWVALEQVESIAANAPRFPRDLLWLPAKLSIKDGPTGDVFLPLLYPGSAANSDDQIRLGRATDWSQEPGPVRGIGAKVMLVGDDGVPLVDWRQFEIN